MIIAKLLEKLEQYVDIKMLGQLSAASVKKLIDYFNKNNIYGCEGEKIGKKREKGVW